MDFMQRKLRNETMTDRPLTTIELQRHVRRLVDADLILVGDGEALTAALVGVGCGASTGNEPERSRHLEQFIQTLEALVEAGDLPLTEADPALSIARKAYQPGRD
jgi:hypothetical protein